MLSCFLLEPPLPGWALVCMGSSPPQTGLHGKGGGTLLPGGGSLGHMWPGLLGPKGMRGRARARALGLGRCDRPILQFNSSADVYNRVECISNHSNEIHRNTKRWTDAEFIGEVNGVVLARFVGRDRCRAAPGPRQVPPCLLHWIYWCVVLNRPCWLGTWAPRVIVDIMVGGRVKQWSLWGEGA